MSDEDEIAAELTDVLLELVADGHLELASSRAVAGLASRLFYALENDPELDIAEWLVERDEVSELYIEGDELNAYFRKALRRMNDEDASAKQHPELLRACADAPEDDLLHTRAVYADWLQENGDPRGELMILQLEHAKPKQKKAEKERLAAKLRALLAKHRTHFFSDLTIADDAFNRVQAELEFGFFREARVVDEHNLRTLITIESGQLLRNLTVDAPDLSKVDIVLATTPLPPSLRFLVLRRSSRVYQQTPADKLDLGRALRHLVRLEVAIVEADEVVLHELTNVKRLRHLSIDTKKLDLGPREALGDLAALTELELKVRDADADTVSTLNALFAVHPPPNLTKVMLSEATDVTLATTLANAVLKSAMAKKLVTLHLRNMPITDDVVPLLHGLPPTVADVNLSGTNFTATTVPGLLERWPQCGARAPEQWEYADEDDDDDDEDDDDRYDDADE